MPNIVKQFIYPKKPFPNNDKLPLLLYKQVLEVHNPDAIVEIFSENGWKNNWVNGIYPFHHFHSNTHEALGVVSGSCDVQIGGDDGDIFHNPGCFIHHTQSDRFYRRP